MNVGTGLPLFVSNNDIWNYDEEERLIAAKNGWALVRPWGQFDGGDCGWWEHIGDQLVFKFTFELINDTASR